jgi:predicted nuclease of restriction endonuclease-like (RecB) superfamily
MKTTKTSRKGIANREANNLAGAVETMLPEIRGLIEEARHRAVTAANLSMVTLYWHIGRILTRDIQKGAKRGGYGERLLDGLASRLSREYGPGFSISNLWDMRRFFEAFQIPQPAAVESASTGIPQPVAGEFEILSPAAGESVSVTGLPSLPAARNDRLPIDFSKHYHLGWTHYRILLGIGDARQRRFYFERCCAERWSKRELQRQMAGALFERVALSSNTRALVKLETAKGPPEIANYRDAFKDPYLLDFLGLTGAYSEKDLEAAIISNLQQFLTELGNDFCFIRRQYPMRIDDEDYFLDLLFYHRTLRCLVAVDLKIGPFVAADKGQMDLYLSWLKRHEWRKHENEPVGLILCTSKKRQHVELLLAGGPHKMQVSEYLTRLPDKKILEDQLKLYGKLLEKEGGTK